METAISWLQQAGEAFLALLALPYYYIAILLILLLLLRQTRVERKLFAVRMRAWPALLLRLLVSGLAAGIVVALLSLGLGVQLQQDAIHWLWGTAIVLALFNVRYLCVAYSVGLLGVLQWTADLIPASYWPEQVLPVLDSLLALDIAGLLIIVAALHLVEAILVRLEQKWLSSPRVVKGKRGRLIGAHQLRGLWPIPLIVLVPSTGAAALTLPWQPLLANGAGAGPGAGWVFLALPVIIGFSALTSSKLAASKAAEASRDLLYYAIALGLLGGLAAWWPPLVPVAALLALLGHEAIALGRLWQERARTSIYVPANDGLRVLAIVPGSPAEELGIQAGETVAKVNGVAVGSVAQLYKVLQSSPAFTKLEVLNHEGHSKFMQRARFAGEHHQLGLILAPDNSAALYTSAGSPSLLGVFGNGVHDRLGRRRSKGAGTPASTEMAADALADSVLASAASDEVTSVVGSKVDHSADSVVDGAADRTVTSAVNEAGSRQETGPERASGAGLAGRGNGTGGGKGTGVGSGPGRTGTGANGGFQA